MNKCIVCECTNVIYYRPPDERPPLKCPDCGRDTRHYTSMKENDPRISILLKKYRERMGETGVSNNDEDSGMFSKENPDGVSEDKEQGNNSYSYNLISRDGAIKIVIPKAGGIIGRTSVGGEQLAHNGKISREHIRLVPAKRAQGVMAEDISANGTLVDGRRLAKNSEEFVVIGSEITMGGEVFVLTREEGYE